MQFRLCRLFVIFKVHDEWHRRTSNISRCQIRLWIERIDECKRVVIWIQNWHLMWRQFVQVRGIQLLILRLWRLIFRHFSGVGVKTHKAGPTHCTKLKVYRPKTCGVVPKPLDTSTLNGRIASPCLIADKVRPMDLAICWDYRPLDPRNEPKPPPHIDGSNGNVAPAVFTVVKTPRSPDVELPTGRSGGVFSNTIGEEDFFDKDIMRRNRSYFSTRLERNTDRMCHCENSTPNRSTSATRDAKLSPLQPIKLADRCKSSPSLSMVAQASNSSANPNEKIIVCNYNQEHYHVRPVTVKCQSRDSLKSNERSSRSKASHRLCEKNLHELNRSSSRSNIQAKVEYKCAFKAGIPKSSSSGFGSSFDGSQSSTSEKAKTIKIPKPKPPYAKKNYVIDTLAPPFACWKGNKNQASINAVCQFLWLSFRLCRQVVQVKAVIQSIGDCRASIDKHTNRLNSGNDHCSQQFISEKTD